MVRCISSGLVIAAFEGSPIALIVGAEQGPPHGRMEVRVEGISSDEHAVSRLLAALRAAMLEHNVFRGKVFSLSLSGAVTFPAIPVVERDAVVLPEGTLERLERHAIGIAEHAERLRAAGRHLKRGVLLHGPPGTGKTLTVNYLLSAMRGRTAVILTGSALGLIEEAFSHDARWSRAAVRAAQPARRARRGRRPAGAADDQPAGQDRAGARGAAPGRVDLALELPLPDEDGRRRLFALYAQQIVLDPDTERELVARSGGVTGALIRELMRQATLQATLNDIEPQAADVLAILDDLLQERATLTRRLLGQPPGADGSDAIASPSMFRALSAAGLPVGPELRERR